MNFLRRTGSNTRKAALLLALALGARPGAAINGQTGDFKWSWGTTLGYGLGLRLLPTDKQIIGIAAGGTGYSVNGDDGNQNYRTGIFTNAGTVTTELELSYKNVGGFVRVFGFYDYENEKVARARTPLSEDALKRVGSRIEIRDAFLWYRFNLGTLPGEIRAGWQVINWGESTFLQGGINAINPVDVSALRVPGAELRDALLPVGAIKLSLKPSESTSFEAFYQYAWAKTQIDAVGSYFSTTDLAGAGANKVLLGFGSVPDTLPVGYPINQPTGVVVPRGSDLEAKDSGQWGASFKLLTENLGGAEFGLYFINYHSRLPVIMANTGSLAGVANKNYAATASYFLAYPENIKLLGLSFNTQLGRTGIALQGEVSHRWDVPLQMDDVELLYAALSPLSPFLAANNQIGAYGFSQEITGYKKFQTTQVQMTATKAFSRVLGADQLVLVVEGAWSKVHDLPDKNVLRLEAPGTYTSGNPIFTAAKVQPATEPNSAFPTSSAWGYVLAGRLDFFNAIGAVSISPRFSFAQDVNGISPGPGGAFLQDRMALSVGLGFKYLINWDLDMNYTSYLGADRYNLLRDRDFFGANIKYSF
jgi:hypothetical protein